MKYTFNFLFLCLICGCSPHGYRVRIEPIEPYTGPPSYPGPYVPTEEVEVIGTGPSTQIKVTPSASSNPLPPLKSEKPPLILPESKPETLRWDFTLFPKR